MKNINIPIKGKVIINNVSMTADNIKVTNKNVLVYNETKFISKIQRNEIKTLYELNGKLKTDIIDNIIYLFDITKIGDT